MCESGIPQLCDELAPTTSTTTMQHPAAMAGDDVCVTNSIIVVRRDPNPEECGGGGELRPASVIEGNYNLSCASSSGISSIRSSDNEAIRRKMCGGGRASQKFVKRSWASYELIHGHKKRFSAKEGGRLCGNVAPQFHPTHD